MVRRRARAGQGGGDEYHARVAARRPASAESVLPHLRAAKDLMDRAYSEPLDLDALARRAGYSRYHFLRAFRDAYGETPRTYLTRRRQSGRSPRLSALPTLARGGRRKEDDMIKRLSHAGVPVLDQDSAKALYTEKLGFEVRTDATMDEFRWLTVGPPDQPDFEFILYEPGPPMHDEESAQHIRALVAKGALGGGVWETDDVRKTYEELSANGVEFLQEPAERPYGIEAVFRDDSGNWFSLTQRTQP